MILRTASKSGSTSPIINSRLGRTNRKCNNIISEELLPVNFQLVLLTKM